MKNLFLFLLPILLVATVTQGQITFSYNESYTVCGLGNHSVDVVASDAVSLDTLVFTMESGYNAEKVDTLSVSLSADSKTISIPFQYEDLMYPHTLYAYITGSTQEIFSFPITIKNIPTEILGNVNGHYGYNAGKGETTIFAVYKTESYGRSESYQSGNQTWAWSVASNGTGTATIENGYESTSNCPVTFNEIGSYTLQCEYTEDGCSTTLTKPITIFSSSTDTVYACPGSEASVSIEATSMPEKCFLIENSDDTEYIMPTYSESKITFSYSFSEAGDYSEYLVVADDTVGVFIFRISTSPIINVKEDLSVSQDGRITKINTPYTFYVANWQDGGRYLWQIPKECTVVCNTEDSSSVQISFPACDSVYSITCYAKDSMCQIEPANLTVSIPHDYVLQSTWPVGNTSGGGYNFYMPKDSSCVLSFYDNATQQTSAPDSIKYSKSNGYSVISGNTITAISYGETSGEDIISVYKGGNVYETRFNTQEKNTAVAIKFPTPIGLDTINVDDITLELGSVYSFDVLLLSSFTNKYDEYGGKLSRSSITIGSPSNTILALTEAGNIITTGVGTDTIYISLNNANYRCIANVSCTIESLTWNGMEGGTIKLPLPLASQQNDTYALTVTNKDGFNVDYSTIRVENTQKELLANSFEGNVFRGIYRIGTETVRYITKEKTEAGFNPEYELGTFDVSVQANPDMWTLSPDPSQLLVGQLGASFTPIVKDEYGNEISGAIKLDIAGETGGVNTQNIYNISLTEEITQCPISITDANGYITELGTYTILSVSPNSSLLPNQSQINLQVLGVPSDPITFTYGGVDVTEYVSLTSLSPQSFSIDEISKTVNPLSPGTGAISGELKATFIPEDFSIIPANISVNIVNPPISELYIWPMDTTLLFGDTAEIKLSYMPEIADTIAIHWKLGSTQVHPIMMMPSSKTTSMSITAVSPGNDTVKAINISEGETLIASCNVTVLDPAKLRFDKNCKTSFVPLGSESSPELTIQYPFLQGSDTIYQDVTSLVASKVKVMANGAELTSEYGVYSFAHTEPGQTMVKLQYGDIPIDTIMFIAYQNPPVVELSDTLLYVGDELKISITLDGADITNYFEFNTTTIEENIFQQGNEIGTYTCIGAPAETSYWFDATLSLNQECSPNFYVETASVIVKPDWYKILVDNADIEQVNMSINETKALSLVKNERDTMGISNVGWEYSPVDSVVAAIREEGLLHAKEAGTQIISAKINDVVLDELVVTVMPPHVLTFDWENESDASFVAVDSTINVCLLFDGEPLPEAYTVTYTNTSSVEGAISITPNGSCVAIKGLSTEGNIYAEGIVQAEVGVEGTRYPAEMSVQVYNSKLPTPVYENDTIAVCFSSENREGVTLEEYVWPTHGLGTLQWYSADKVALTSAPKIDMTKLGYKTYYVSQKPAVGVNAGGLIFVESDMARITMNVLYVPEPTLTMTDQKICGDGQFTTFEAKAPQGCTLYWSKDEYSEPMQGNTYTPVLETESGYGFGSAIVYAEDAMLGCVSNPVKVTYARGIVPAVTIYTMDQRVLLEYVQGETVALGVLLEDVNYSQIWNFMGDFSQEYSFIKTIDSVGVYPIQCTVVDRETGCSAADVVEVSVIKQDVPLTSISATPTNLQLYEGQKEIVKLAFAPINATNKEYTASIADNSIVDVVGTTIIAIAEGETTVTFASVENPNLVAEVYVLVSKNIPVQQISMTKIITMGVGEQKDVVATVLPTNATNSAVSFKAKTTNVLSIDEKGHIVALGVGSATIVAYTQSGATASALVYVTANNEAITNITVPEKVEMKVSDSISISYKVSTLTQTATLAISELQWVIDDPTVVTITADGVVKALKVGTTTVTVSYKDASAVVQVVVKPSAVPTIAQIPAISINQGGTTTIDLTTLVSDDVTPFNELQFTTEAAHVTTSVVSGSLIVTSADLSFFGADTISLTVTDADGGFATAYIPVEVKAVENKAPWLKMHEYVLQNTSSCHYIALTDLVEDDLTNQMSLVYTLSTRDNNVAVKIMSKTRLRIVPINATMTEEVIYITISDGVNSTKDSVTVYVGSIPNKAPQVANIPMQYENDTMTFANINFANYVTDDYTTPASIAWTASSSDNMGINIVNGVAEINVLNAFWNGVEAITFKAQDEEGLVDSTIVYFMRTVTTTGSTTTGDDEVAATWEGAPVFDIIAMRTLGVPSDQFIVMVNMSGYDYSNYTWQWDIPGANNIDQTSLMQFVTFDNPGVYSVSFTVQSGDGVFSKVVTKENLLTVAGISNRNPKVCKGQALTLQASEGMTSYYWNTGDVKSSTTIRPEKTKTIAVTMKKGMFVLTDSVKVHVSVPVALMQDSVMCEGTSFDLSAPENYASYKWNTGDEVRSITIPDVVASYVVTTIDTLQCLSTDTFNLTKVNPLPEINLGEDQTPCSVKETVVLDAGAGYSYLWSDGTTEQTLTLIDSTHTVSAQITDANGCINSDTVTVAFKYPYKEQIGVVTFSEISENLIIAWEKTVGVNTISYRVERETDLTDNWEQVGDVVAFNQPALVVDESTDYQKRAYKYRLVTIDGCQNEAISDYHRSMHLVTTLQPDKRINLLWTAYEPMENVTQYRVLKGTDVNALDTVESLPASNMYETWSETDLYNKDMKYKVVFKLKQDINENRYKNVDGETVDEYGNLKAESGPFSLALSNIAEAENAQPEAINSVELPAKVVVFPTKVTNEVSVQISSNYEEEYLVELLNASGQVVAKQKTSASTESIVTIPMTPFTQGMYNVRVSANNKMTTVKIVK